MRKYITKEQAIHVLPDGDFVHTFYNYEFGLVGADLSKDEIIDKINSSEIIELTGENARKMGHGMCLYDKNTKWHSEILFVETDEEKLTETDKRDLED